MEHNLESYEKLVLDDRELPVKIVINYKTERGTYFKAHWHEFMELHFVVSGHAQIILNYEHIAINKGDLLVINGNMLHRGYCDGTPVEVLVLIFELKEISQEIANDNAIFQSIISEDSNIKHIMMKIYKEFKEKQLGYHQMCKGAILELLVYLSRNYVVERLSDSEKQKKLRKLECLNKVVHHIRKHYREPISNAELAALIHLSEDRFCHLFKEVMGMSPLQYRNRIRLKKARYLLSTGEYTATQVADAVGFKDYNHFGRLFRRYYGYTPMQVKKNNQNEEAQLEMDGANI